jgi:aromatic-L-amino-acid/L-tryptophan decarboxylase
MSLKVFGAAAFPEAVSRGFHLAAFAEAALREAGCWEIVSPAQMAVVAFRYAAADRSPEELEEITASLAGAMAVDGYAALSSTALRGRTALRFCTINPRTTEEEIAETVRRLGRAAGR